MAIQHPVFCRKVEKNKVLVLTVVDIDSLPIAKDDVDVFFIATTESSILTGKNPTITIHTNSKVSAKRYVEIINDKGGGYGVHDTASMSIDGIATEAYWFIKKTKSMMEQMYG